MHVVETPETSSGTALPGRGRFRRTARLLRRGDFERVYRGGRRHLARDLTLFWRRRDSGGGPRIGFTVGRVLGGAVDRNRIKRRLREATRLSLGRLSCPVDVVMNPRKSALKVDFSELLQQVAAAFHAIEQEFARGQGRAQESR